MTVTPQTNWCDSRQRHSYWLADVAQVQAEGTVTLLYFCTACGLAMSHKFQVATPHNGIAMTGSPNATNSQKNKEDI